MRNREEKFLEDFNIIEGVYRCSLQGVLGNKMWLKISVKDQNGDFFRTF